MSGAEWWGYLVRGLGGLGVSSVLFLMARWRYARRKDEREPADLGLD
jgi:hypothetical protein